MKRLTVILVAGLVAAAATPAMAVVTYTPQPSSGFNFGIGVYNPNDPTSLNTVYVDSGSGLGQSATFVVTMAAQMNAIFYNTESLHFSFLYDNSMIEVLHARPVAPVGGPQWATNNYSSITWPNPSSGITGYINLTQSMGTGTTYMPMNTGAVVPFFQATLHIKDVPTASHVAPFGITIPPYTPGGGYGVGMTLVSHTYALTLTPLDFSYFGGEIHGVPEPSMAMLLVGGGAACAGGWARRRRRAA